MFCRTLFPADRPDLTIRILEMSNVHPDSRSFHLSIDDFERLCLAYEKICTDEPALFDFDYRSHENARTWRETAKSIDL